MSVIFYNNVRVLVFNHLGKLSKESGLSDTCHVLQTKFFGTCFNLLVGEFAVVFQGMYGRSGYAECCLRYHACLLSPFNGRCNVANIVQTVEDTRNVYALCVLHLIHQSADIVGHGIHTQCVQTAVEHVCLYAGIVQYLCIGTDRFVWILSCEQIYLFECTAICLYAGKTAHFYKYWSNVYQLVFAWLELSRALPHISINETKLNFLCHLLYFILSSCSCPKYVMRTCITVCKFR